MYLEFYNLKEKPFSLTPDPAFLYYSVSHKRAIAFLQYGLQESKGFLQLTGPIGSGKTTLLRAVLSRLDEKTKTAYLINPRASFPELLRAVMKDLEIPNIPATSSKMDLLDFFHEYLLVQVRRNFPVIIIFDESQNLSLTNLEEIRMLSNFETSKEKLLQIVLVGQPEFAETLNLPELRQLKQRIQVRYHLSPLQPAEVRGYIRHRLHVAGSNGQITFTDEACETIFTFSGGIPRLVNAVCDIALLIGYVNEQHALGKDTIVEAIRELEGRFGESAELREEEPEEPLEDEPPAQEANACPVPDEAPEQPSPQPAKLQQPVADHKENRPEPASTTDQNDGNAQDGAPALHQTVIGGLRRDFTSPPVRTQGCDSGSNDSDSQPERKIATVPLYSFLRRRSMRRFRTIGWGMVNLEGTGGVHLRLRRFIERHVGRNGSGAGAAESEIVRQPDSITGEVNCVLRDRSAQGSERPPEEFEPLTYQGLSALHDTCAPSSQEALADAEFARDDFASALREYEKLRILKPASMRLALKVSLCYLNLGIQFMRMRQYTEAKNALKLVDIDTGLREKAARIASCLDALMKQKNEEESASGAAGNKGRLPCQKLSER
jgi:general secretion pathway protein A